MEISGRIPDEGESVDVPISDGVLSLTVTDAEESKINRLNITHHIGKTDSSPAG